MMINVPHQAAASGERPLPNSVGVIIANEQSADEVGGNKNENGTELIFPIKGKEGSSLIFIKRENLYFCQNCELHHSGKRDRRKRAGTEGIKESSIREHARDEHRLKVSWSQVGDEVKFATELSQISCQYCGKPFKRYHQGCKPHEKKCPKRPTAETTVLETRQTSKRRSRLQAPRTEPQDFPLEATTSTAAATEPNSIPHDLSKRSKRKRSDSSPPAPVIQSQYIQPSSSKGDQPALTATSLAKTSQEDPAPGIPPPATEFFEPELPQNQAVSTVLAHHHEDGQEHWRDQ